jgi:Folate-sensitive fragile site protein Fra10Ac1
MDSREISSVSKVGASSSGSESAMERHRQLMALYTSSGQSDKDVLASNHQFVRDDADDSQNHGKDDWGIRMARKYYAKLYKE